MVILTVAEGNLPLLQFFASRTVKLQAPVTGGADIISEDVTHVVQHTNHTGSDGFGWRSTMLWYRRRTFRRGLTRFIVIYICFLPLLHHLHGFTDDHIAHWLELFLLRERNTLWF